MEYDEDGQESGGFFSRLKESPRTVSVLIIILIVAAAIYAFSGDNSQAPTTSDSGNQATATEDNGGTTEPTEGGTGEEMQSAEDSGKVAGDTTATPAPVTPESLVEQSNALPDGEKTADGYIETAVKGDGLTHLARRAATRYLSENDAGYAITNEHRIYIEDYIKDHLPRQSLNPGDQMPITNDLIKEAVDSAGNLSAKQLQNLTKYTYVFSK